MRDLCFALFLFGCGGTNIGWMPLNEPPRPAAPRPKNEVRMFTSARPTDPYVEVGLITVAIKSGWSGSTDLEMIDQVKSEGAKHGCDGVVIENENKLTQGSAYHGTYSSDLTVSERTSGFRCVCIMFENGK